MNNYYDLIKWAKGERLILKNKLNMVWGNGYYEKDHIKQAMYFGRLGALNDLLKYMQVNNMEVNNMQVDDMIKKAGVINMMLKHNNAHYRIGIRRDRLNKVYDIYIIFLKIDGFTTECNRYYFSGNIKEICSELDNIECFLDITLNRKV